MPNPRDDFSEQIKNKLKQRAAFICSNPNCKALTISPSNSSDEQVVYIGKTAHIYAAAKNGPRYDPNMTEEGRSSINNAIFLCSNCATMIDCNNGLDFSVDLLRQWKVDHESWVVSNLNKPITQNSELTSNVTSYNQIGGITANKVNL